ncbi:MAG: amidohydrolase family protein, partial [Clostridia bacterium]|nr:amidohydrolase family protein [Clostridia bacterium]
MNKCISGNMYVWGHGLVKCTARIEDGRIVALEKFSGENAIPDDLLVLPGFIDKHIHGAAGVDCMRNEDALKAMSAALVKEGVTRFLPTTMTGPKKDILSALKRMGKQIEEGGFSGAKPIGIHLEGPFIAPEKAGAQPKEDILSFSEELFDEMNAAARGKIMQVTYAPEKNPGMTAALVRRGVVASVGHTSASAEQVLQAEKEGATSATHV